MDVLATDRQNRIVEGLNAIVTGGSRVIGEASAYALAREGANVAIAINKSLDEAEVVVKNIQKLGVSACAFQCDVSNPDEVNRLVNNVVTHWGENRYFSEQRRHDAWSCRRRFIF